MLLSVAGFLVGALVLLQPNVIYTEGEVIQGLYSLLVAVVAGSVLIGIGSRKAAFWVVVALGGTLLLWQLNQTRRWAQLQEEIVSIVRHSEQVRQSSGAYPTNLAGYAFKHQWVGANIWDISTNSDHGFRISYFLNQPGITYWYSSKSGFGYYPD
jgi:hypothetical protein